MKTFIDHARLRGFLFVFNMLMCGFFLSAQEGVSTTVEFKLNNMPDMDPPSITMLSPVFDENGLFRTEEKEVELMGEITDASKIRFVSINTEIWMLNETGIFAQTLSLVPGKNQILIKSMDEHNHMRELIFTIESTPPVLTLEDKILKESKYYGLVIGIDNYRDPSIPDLDNPVKDAKNIFESLTTYYTFEEEDVVFLKNPRRSEIIEELDGLRGKITPEDNLLIFYAGHGYWDEEARIGYWLPSDATKKTTADWFRNSTLVDYLQAITSKHTLLITDACFAGSIFKARSITLDNEMVYDRIYEIPSRKAMTSGAMTEVPDRSAFIKYLVQRLNENREIYLSSEELFSSFRMAVISNSSVLPQYGEIQNVGNQGGDFIFLKRK